MTDKISPEEIEPENTGAHPSVSADDELQRAIDEALARPKQNEAQFESSTEPEDTEEGGASGDPSEPEDTLADVGAEALSESGENIVELLDTITSEYAAHYALTKDTKPFEMSPAKKAKCGKLLAKIMAKHGAKWEIGPEWVLIIIVLLHAWAVYQLASAMREKNMRKPATETAAPKPHVSESAKNTEPPVHTPPRKPASPPPMPTAPAPTPGFWTTRPNPISPEKNEDRKQRGGGLCPNCGHNHVEPERTTCSSVCNTTWLNKKRRYESQKLAYEHFQANAGQAE